MRDKEDYIRSDPEFFKMIRNSALLMTAALALTATFWSSPLEGPADPARVPNPAKSAWFLLWIQELLSWSKALSWLLLLGFLAMIALPWLDHSEKQVEQARWFSSERKTLNRLVVLWVLVLLILSLIAAVFRGENWAWAGEFRKGSDQCVVCHSRIGLRPHFAAATCSFCHRGNPEASRKELAHLGLVPARMAGFYRADSPAVLSGKSLARVHGCRRCHRIEGFGQPLASNLDRAGRERSAQELLRAIREPASGMPSFHFDDAQLADLGTWILRLPLISNERAEARSALRVIHFAPVDSPEGEVQTVFSAKCGSCHQLLSASRGLLGKGAVAPNLSGVFTAFFPAENLQLGFWNSSRLSTWIQNPRSLKSGAMMPPVKVTAAEWIRLLGELETAPAPCVSSSPP